MILGRGFYYLLSALHGPDHLFMHSCLDGAPDPIPGSDVFDAPPCRGLFSLGVGNDRVAVWPSHPVGKFWNRVARAQFWGYDRQHGFTIGGDLGIAFLVCVGAVVHRFLR